MEGSRRARAWLLVAVLTAAVVVAALPAAAAGTDPPSVLGRDVRHLPNGLWEVRLPDGIALTTHGPDPKPDHGSGLGPGDPERAPVCATGYVQHVLYARLLLSTDRYASVKGSIQASMRRIDAVLNEEALESGAVGADYKVRCDAMGQIEVGSFTTTGSDFNSIVSSARGAGFDDPNVDYSIFYDGDFPGVCGVGSFASDERLSADNANNGGGDYAITYISCWSGLTPMHENGHNQGAVQYDAPYSTGDGAHCWDENDVMCYSPDGGDKHQTGTINRCADKLHFDCGHDDYFDAAPEPGEYLASNWNIGSALNRFIVFGGTVNLPPSASYTASCSGLPCSFADTSTDADGTIAARAWDFGDGATSTAAAPTHTYATGGAYLMRLTVTDDGGATATVTRTITPPTAPSIASPAEGATIATTPVTVSGTGPPSATIAVRESGTALATVTAAGNGAWSARVSLGSGTHTIDAVATTPEGVSAPSAPRTFTVVPDPTPPPKPVVTSPVSGARTGPNVTVTGTAEPSSTVWIYDGARLAKGVPAQDSGAFATTVIIEVTGSHTLTVASVDAAGNVGPPSDPVTIEVDATAPTIEITSGAVIAAGQPFEITGTAGDNTGVARVVVDFFDTLNRRIATVDATLGPPDAGGTRSWSASPAAFAAPGRYRVTAYAVDFYGLRSPTAYTFVYKLG